MTKRFTMVVNIVAGVILCVVLIGAVCILLISCATPPEVSARHAVREAEEGIGILKITPSAHLMYREGGGTVAGYVWEIDGAICFRGGGAGLHCVAKP